MDCGLDRGRPALTRVSGVRERLAGVGLWVGPLTFLALFYALPLASILALAVGRAGNVMSPILEAAASGTVRRAFAFTWLEATVSTALTLAVGLPGAYLLARVRFPGKALLRALTAVPFVLPTLVVAAAFDALLSPNGLVNGVLALLPGSPPKIELSETLAAILAAHVFYNAGIVMRLVGDAWAHLDPELGNAAHVLGAGPAQTARRVTAPLLAPAVTAAALLVFLFTFTSFGVILVLGGPRFATLEVEIYYQTVALFDLPVAAVLSILQLACTLAVTVAYTQFARRATRPHRLRSAAATARVPGSPAGRFIAAAAGALLVLFLLVPLAALAIRSVTPTDPAYQGGPTLDYYRALGTNPRHSAFEASPAVAVATSLGYAAATAAMAIALGLPAAWALVRRPLSRGGRVLEPLLLLPLGTSAVTLGLGFVVALDAPPLDLRASPMLVPLAHTLVAFPFVVRVLVPSLATIQPRLREAAAVLGAAPREVARRIDMPLVARALAVAGMFAFMISMGEFGATSLVARPEYPTVPVAIGRLLSRPGALNVGQAMALSTILMAVTAAGMIMIERLRVAAVGEF